RVRAPRAAAPKSPSRQARLGVQQLETRLVPAVTFHGGAVLPKVEAQAVYLGSDWNGTTALRQQVGTTEGFVKDVVNSGYMDMLQYAGYNVGRGSATAGYTDPTALSKTSPLADAAIQARLQADITAKTVAAPDANRLYVVFVEPDVEVVGTDASSRHSGLQNSVQDFLGYHGAFAGKRADGGAASIRYAVICYPGGAPNNAGIGSPYSAVQDM